MSIPSPVSVLKFNVPIDQKSTFDLIGRMEALIHSNPQPKAVRVEINSRGGEFTFGVLLHDYFKWYPLELTVVNVGAVASSALTAFLGAKRRAMQPGASFMIHKVVLGYPDGPPTAEERILDLKRKQEQDTFLLEFYEANLKLNSSEREQFKTMDCDFIGDRPMECGLVNVAYPEL